MKIRQLFFAAAAVSLTAVPVFANSGMTWWEGTDTAGVLTDDEDCPLEVLHEDLDFNAADLPKTAYQSQEEFLSYNSTLNAEYTFYNPSDLHVRAVLSFPLGKLPQYAYSAFDEYEEDPDPAKIRDSYSVLINGDKTDVQLRGTYISYEEFDAEKDIARLHDSYQDDPFYRHDMPVQHYIFEIRGIDEKETSAAVKCRFEEDASKTRLIFNPFNGGTFTDEYSDVQVWAECGSLEMFVIGEDLEDIPEWTVVRGGDNDTEIPGEVKLISRDIMTLEEYVLSGTAVTAGIPDTDKYNAWVEMTNSFNGLKLVQEQDYLVNNSLLYWYQYEIELDPGESLINTVTAPLYLSIDQSRQDPVYSYTYYLSPASCWRKFGSLDINIHTDLKMTAQHPEGFEKTEDGYSLKLSSLPEGELEFSLCSVEDPKKKQMNYMVPLPYLILPLAVIIGLIILLRK